MYRLLEVMDLAFNYFATEESLEPVLELTRLQSVLIYGNPVLGSSGEDPSGIYVEELINKSFIAREGYTNKPLEVIYSTI
jgi:hypothetical protein